MALPRDYAVANPVFRSVWARPTHVSREAAYLQIGAKAQLSLRAAAGTAAAGGAPIEAEPVLEARAPAALNGDAENADVRLLGDQLLDLDSRRLRDGHQR